MVQDFVGWDHYFDLMHTAEFRKSMMGTFLFVLYTIPAEIIIALFFAVIVSEKLRGIDVFRTIFSSTLGVSVAAGATIFLFLFHPSLGVLNNILGMAGIDGAGYWPRLFKITIPMLSPVLFFVTIIAVIGSFQTFGQIDTLTGGGPAGSTNIIVYR